LTNTFWPPNSLGSDFRIDSHLKTSLLRARSVRFLAGWESDAVGLGCLRVILTRQKAIHQLCRRPCGCRPWPNAERPPIHASWGFSCIEPRRLLPAPLSAHQRRHLGRLPIGTQTVMLKMTALGLCLDTRSITPQASGPAPVLCSAIQLLAGTDRRRGATNAPASPPTKTRASPLEDAVPGSCV
jgi:hypothetical protein